MCEKVQRRATKPVLGFILHRLEERVLRGDLIETYKLLTGMENVNPDTFFSINLYNLRGHGKTLNKQRCMKLCRRRFYNQKGTYLQFY